MLANFAPDRPNTHGARWNPADVPALYLSCSFDGAVAEGDHLIGLQYPAPRVKRSVYEVEIALSTILDLTVPGALATLGVSNDDIGSDDLAACQAAGGACAWTEVEGIFVPSARSTATNLVVFTTWLNPESVVEPGDPTIIFDPSVHGRREVGH
ncbi:MAG: RES family NAD+ phosphorylase [Actinobacteria bacterium]|nr:RES family NAD+ phosphorylase [Actinomycetota bacterium]